jgi:hypothetical protein
MSENLEAIKARMAKEAEDRRLAAQTIAAEEAASVGVKLDTLDPASDEARIEAERKRILDRNNPDKSIIEQQFNMEQKNKELLALSPEELLKKIRIFRSRIPGSSFVMKEGYTIYFTEGWYETSDPSEIVQLDAVANKTPAIYTDEQEAQIIAAIIEARKQGFTGTIGEALSQQLTIEQRIAAMRHGKVAGPKTWKNPNALHLPTQGMPQGVTQSEGVKTEASLREAIRNASKQSNAGQQ